MQSRKAKGRNLQKLVREKLLETFSPTLEADDVKSTSMGASGIDVTLSPLAQRCFPWAVECKSLAKVAVYSYYEQAKANSTEKLRPMVVIKANGKEPLVIVSLDNFMELYENRQTD